MGLALLGGTREKIELGFMFGSRKFAMLRGEGLASLGNVRRHRWRVFSLLYFYLYILSIVFSSNNPPFNKAHLSSNYPTSLSFFFPSSAPERRIQSSTYLASAIHVICLLDGTSMSPISTFNEILLPLQHLPFYYHPFYQVRQSNPTLRRFG